jgi:hypothetical protein
MELITASATIGNKSRIVNLLAIVASDTLGTIFTKSGETVRAIATDGIADSNHLKMTFLALLSIAYLSAMLAWV